MWGRLPIALMVAMVASIGLLGCGGSAGHANLAVSLESKQSASARPGDRATYTLTVSNRDPVEASGVSLQVDLPASFRYSSTVAIDDTNDAARTQPTDPPLHTQNPAWGTWSLGGATVNADGTKRLSGVSLTFIADVDGSPGHYDITPHATSDTAEGGVAGAPLGFDLVSAPRLLVSLSTADRNIRAGQVAHYRLTVENDGSAPAKGVAITITLPPVLQYIATDQTSGNSSRSGAVDPTMGSLVPFWSGYSVPARSGSGPGQLVIAFEAQSLATAAVGTYTASVVLTDQSGTVATVADAAPVGVAGLRTPAPTATPSPRLTPSPRPTP